MDTISRVNQFTSILPYELVEEIFLLCRSPFEWGDHDCDPKPHPPVTNVPLLLSHVSKTWREIVHATPALWTNVCIHNQPPRPHPEILQQILRYSGDRCLAACIGIYGLNSNFMEWIDVRIQELFRHSDRICSFRLLIRLQGNLWGENIPVPPFPRLEKLTVKFRSLPGHSVARLHPLFDSPRLQKVIWISDDQYPKPLLRMGAQIKELIFPRPLVNYVQLAELLQACPNLTYLNVCPRGRYHPVPNYPIHLQDLHTFCSNELGVDLVIAPNLRRLTLTQAPAGHPHKMMHLHQFLALAPQIEYINLDLWNDDDLIFQIAPLTPCLATLEFNFRAVPDVSTLNKVFAMLTHSHTGAPSSPLPKLQHLILDVLKFGRDAEPLVYDAEMLLHMLGSRCGPNQTSLDRTVAALRSCTMNYKDYRGDPIHDSPLSRAADAKRCLEVLGRHGLVLQGNVFTSILSDSQLSYPRSDSNILRFGDS
ncbi:hypothetical protein BJ138DRAFT_1112954 [Hygrophoropsis aurantiaca]|uniref:Uncharacterized protein n=1 Tax=Hygrophoropsis aurantiaca TaxID=72124 RepID=A0ACB8AEV7_9AGAM|nr:hypothetical protein BJ138DRAFT_1112954 [Hygrophoropsis aurantiaca]